MKLETLEYRHPEWVANRRMWADINMCIDPVVALSNPGRFVPQRPGEPNELYRARLSRFVFTPILAGAVRDLVKKLQTGTLLVDSDFDFGNQSWLEFAGQVMEHWVTFGVAYPYLMLDEDENEWELGTLHPLSVVNWCFEAELPWLVQSTTGATTSDRPGEIKSVQSYLVWQGGVGSVFYVEDSRVTGGPQYQMSIGRLDVPESFWLAQFAVSKQLQYTLLENNMTDSAGNLYIQRVRRDSPDSDLNESYLNAVQGMVVTSNAHIVEGNFEFVEASGSSVSTNLDVLNMAAEQLRAIFSLTGGVSSTASGESKRYDYSNLSNTLVAFGSQLTKEIPGFLREAVAKFTGKSRT